jgi:hypothetical protein
MDALDCPDGSVSTPTRGYSTTAQQAFAMLNDPFLIRQCEHIAARLAEKSRGPEAQTESAFQLLLLRNARPARTGEIRSLHPRSRACKCVSVTGQQQRVPLS